MKWIHVLISTGVDQYHCFQTHNRNWKGQTHFHLTQKGQWKDRVELIGKVEPKPIDLLVATILFNKIKDGKNQANEIYLNEP